MHIARVWLSKHFTQYYCYCCVYRVGLCFFFFICFYEIVVHRHIDATPLQTQLCVHARSLFFSLFLSCACIYAVVCARRVALMLYCMFIHSTVYYPEYEYIDTACARVCVLVLVCWSFVCQTDSSARFGCSGLQPIFFFVAYKILFILKCSLLIGWCSR